MQPRSRLVSFTFHCALSFVVLTATLVLVEAILRLRYAEPMRAPAPEIKAIQPYLTLAPEIGFAWRPDIAASENIVFDVRDVEFDPLSTDANGFINAPDAIRSMDDAGGAEVVGLGDSFMEHAARTFHEMFRKSDLNYYSLAIHRQCPPQYTAILQKYAVPLKPKWIVYGIFENDFLETEDFDQWNATNLDWFTYHSGTWCGAPIETDRLTRFYREHLKGVDGLTRVIGSRLRGDNMSIRGPTPGSILRVSESVAEAYNIASENGISFLLVLIPGRGTSIQGTSPESTAYDELLALLRDIDMPTLDLREAFMTHSDPASLYYREDAHWNGKGIETAAHAILESIEHHDALARGAE